MACTLCPHCITPASLPSPLHSAWGGGQAQAGRRAERSISAETLQPGGCRPDKGPHGQPHVRLLSPAPVSLSCGGGRTSAQRWPSSPSPSSPSLCSEAWGSLRPQVARTPGPARPGARHLDQAPHSHRGAAVASFRPGSPPLPGVSPSSQEAGKWVPSHPSTSELGAPVAQAYLGHPPVPMPPASPPGVPGKYGPGSARVLPPGTHPPVTPPAICPKMTWSS